MTNPMIVIGSVVCHALEISMDGYQARILDDLEVITLDLGAGFSYARPCPKCHRGLMPCCSKCQGEGHSEQCPSAEAAAIRARLRSYEVGR
jgi:hypothetical protein